MDGLEIVNVRLADSKTLEDAIAFCHEVLTIGTPVRFHLYRCIGSGMDLGIHIHWSFGPFTQEKSLLGLQLARGLGEYGLVSHSVWICQAVDIPGKRTPASGRMREEH